VLEAVRTVADGAPACVDVVERELGFELQPALERLAALGRVVLARGCCGHCGCQLWQAVAQ